MIEFWHQEESVTNFKRPFQAQFDFHPHQVPASLTIWRIIRKFNTAGTVCDEAKGHSGRKRTGHSEDNVAAVRESVVRSSRKSAWRLSAETNIHPWTVYRILRMDIHVFPYKIQTKRAHSRSETDRCLRFATWFAERLEEDKDFLKKMQSDMSDECHATLSGVMNKQNFRYWGRENPVE